MAALTQPEIDAFFCDADQMRLSIRTQAYLATEGIITPGDLSEFNTKEMWDQIVENYKHPPMITNPGNAQQFVPQMPFRLPAKLLMRLKIAARAVKYYGKVGRPLTADMLNFGSRLTNFKEEYDSLQERKTANNDSSLPIISTKLPIAEWFKAYERFNSNYIGQGGCNLSWVDREYITVAAAEKLALDQPFSDVHGSVDTDMTERLSHTSSQFRVDNAKAFAHIVTATLGTQFAFIIDPFKRQHNGRTGLLAPKAQFLVSLIGTGKQRR